MLQNKSVVGLTKIVCEIFLLSFSILLLVCLFAGLGSARADTADTAVTRFGPDTYKGVSTYPVDDYGFVQGGDVAGGKITRYRHYDTIAFKTLPGSFVSVKSPGVPDVYYYDASLGWFTYNKVRNYQTTFALPIPGNVPLGEYIFRVGREVDDFDAAYRVVVCNRWWFYEC